MGMGLGDDGEVQRVDIGMRVNSNALDRESMSTEFVLSFGGSRRCRIRVSKWWTTSMS